jgi:hypothetical protein
MNVLSGAKFVCGKLLSSVGQGAEWRESRFFVVRVKVLCGVFQGAEWCESRC